ncbi:MAG: T9SS type A sorting domain-containing protein [Candidatus Latescibacteria bacterium]|nr:T9SS type A sorting domain-containing protein [Candidatus Latescibacterota bacterium]
MKSICWGLALMVGLVLSAQAEMPVLELEPGANEVTLMIENQRSTAIRCMDMETIGALPGWLRLAAIAPVDVPARGEGRLVLSAEVGDVALGTLYELAFALRDEASHSWHVNALLKVVAPRAYALSCNYPNPFNPVTTIAFSIPQPDSRLAPASEAAAVKCRLFVYNLLGQRVKILVDEVKAPGRHKVQWDGTDESGRRIASGIYFYRLMAGDFVKTRKMLLLQ